MRNKHNLHAFLTVALIIAFLSLTLLPGTDVATAKPSQNPAPSLSWSKLYSGATAVDGWPYIVIQTCDGGFAIAGRQATGSGNFAFWLLKTNAKGQLQWSKTYGGSSYSKVVTLIQTQDGGYLLGGDTWAYSGFYDAFLIKTNAQGDMNWSKVYGGSGVDTVLSVLQTKDGGYIWAGDTSSFGSGGYDFWVVRIDTTGNIIWDKTYGGTSDDVANRIIPTADGGYAVFGSTWSYSARSADWWLVKIDSNGNKQWDKSYDGNGWDDPRATLQTCDGGYVMFGSTASGVLSSDMKIWLVKADNSGNLLWSKTYGGSGTEQAGWSLINTKDGGFAFVGRTTSLGAGGNDFWFVKTNSNGVLQFNQTYGGVSDDIGTSATGTNDGGFALAGYTNSFNNGDSYSVWLIKLK